jgi:hypothetical protein
MNASERVITTPEGSFGDPNLGDLEGERRILSYFTWLCGAGHTSVVRSATAIPSDTSTKR